MKSVEVSIVIVNWNSKDYLRKCIDSIITSTRRIEFEIIVVDNASFDGCDDMLRRDYPQAKFVQSEKNEGFARANNIAARLSCGPTLLFLNPDTEIRDSAIENLFYSLTLVENTGIVGARLLNSDLTVQTSSVQSFPTIANQLLDSNLLRRKVPLARLWGMSALYSDNLNPIEVDVVSGACLMIKRSAFETVGEFSDEYFMYSEDVDLCFKVKKAGFKVFYVPTAVIVHHGGTSSSQSKQATFANVMMLESRFRFFRKTRPLWYCRLYRVSMGLGCAVRIALLSIAWTILWGQKRRISIRSILKKWAARLRWTWGGEKWVTRHGSSADCGGGLIKK